MTNDQLDHEATSYKCLVCTAPVSIGDDCDHAGIDLQKFDRLGPDVEDRIRRIYADNTGEALTPSAWNELEPIDAADLVAAALLVPVTPCRDCGTSIAYDEDREYCADCLKANGVVDVDLDAIRARDVEASTAAGIDATTSTDEPFDGYDANVAAGLPPDGDVGDGILSVEYEVLVSVKVKGDEVVAVWLHLDDFTSVYPLRVWDESTGEYPAERAADGTIDVDALPANVKAAIEAADLVVVPTRTVPFKVARP